MNKIILTKQQIDTIKKIMDFDNLDQVELQYSSESGIGPNAQVIVPDSSPVDITDVSNW